MTRLRLLLLLAMAVLSSCGKTPMPDVFSETVGGWRRTTLRDVPAGQPPDAIPAQEIERIHAATYEGTGKLEARIYGLASAAKALDVAQRWRPAADTVFFDSDRFFVVVKWQGADRKALQAFVSELQKRLTRK
jgi:hypothetical protein